MNDYKHLVSLLLMSDSYKYSHWLQYPPDTSYMFSYLESRGGLFPATVSFGFQMYLKKYLTHRITREQVDYAATFAAKHGVPFNRKGWERIAKNLGGKLPVRIRAVPEGTVVPTRNILMSVESTDPETFWIVSWLETMLVRLWYPITVATLSYYTKQAILESLEATGDPETIGFKLHDFGSRGVSSQESAAIGGAAHLVNFLGSDTIDGVVAANEYYNCDMAGFSISASEHSTMTMWGKDREEQAYANMLEQYRDAPLFACVSDSYDIYNATENIWGGSLKDKVRANKGMVVIRPDSGNPSDVCLKLLEILSDKFGFTVNDKGYKVLNDVRIIQGDGMNYNSIKQLLTDVTSKRYSADNLAFGMGGGLLQKGIDRDTQNFAFKCSSATVDGKEIDVYKEPVTSKMKHSKRGVLELDYKEGMYATVRRDEVENPVMRDIFLNGEILVEETFDEIRKRANGGE